MAYLTRTRFFARVRFVMGGKEHRAGEEVQGFGIMDPARMEASGYIRRETEWVCEECGLGFPSVGLVEAHACSEIGRGQRKGRARQAA